MVVASTEGESTIETGKSHTSNVQNRNSDSNLPLQRVKRKGFGSFFGVLDSKTTPNTISNTWNNPQNGQQFPPGASNGMYGSSGSDQFNRNSYYLNNNYRESNLYYLIVSIITFSILVYCCNQCRTNRNLEDRYEDRHQTDNARQLMNGDSSLITNNANANTNYLNNLSVSNQQNAQDDLFKHMPSAPLEPFIAPVQQMTATNRTANYPAYPNYSNSHADESFADKPPSYQEAIAAATLK